jgi:hypothetical protein
MTTIKFHLGLKILWTCSIVLLSVASCSSAYLIFHACVRRKPFLLSRHYTADYIPPPKQRGPPPGGDMAYVQENIQRQMNTYAAIRDIGGAECARDVYARAPPSTQCWYIGKLAFTSGTTSSEVALSRQWNLVEEHATRLRPVELGRSFGRIELYTAPADSELQVAENQIPLTRIPRVPSEQVSLREIGFYCEVVTNQGIGFCANRAPDGSLLQDSS